MYVSASCYNSQFDNNMGVDRPPPKSLRSFAKDIWHLYHLPNYGLKSTFMVNNIAIPVANCEIGHVYVRVSVFLFSSPIHVPMDYNAMSIHLRSSRFGTHEHDIEGQEIK